MKRISSNQWLCFASAMIWGVGGFQLLNASHLSGVVSLGAMPGILVGCVGSQRLERGTILVWGLMLVWIVECAMMIVFLRHSVVWGEYLLPLSLLSLSYVLALIGVVRWAKQLAR